MIEINIETNKRNQFKDITPQVNDFVEESKIENGICHIFSPHTTGGITINEGADPDVRKDLNRALSEIVPNIKFNHAEGNSDSHLKTSLVGSSAQVVVQNSELKLGTWQKIYFCEFDGPRSRKAWLELIEK